MFGFMNRTYDPEYINNRRGDDSESEDVLKGYCL